MPTIDARARRVYRTRLGDLEDELREAKMLGDGDRAARVEEEKAAIARELDRHLEASIRTGTAGPRPLLTVD